MKRESAEYIGLHDPLPADCVRGMKAVNDVFDAKEKASAVAYKVHDLLLWAGGAPDVRMEFWSRLEELSRTYDESYGGHEELT